MSSAFKAKCKRTLELMVLNLAAISLSDTTSWLATVSSRSWYSENAFWVGDQVTRASMVKCRAYLIEQGLVTFDRGRPSSSWKLRRSAAVQPTAAFHRLVTMHGITRDYIIRSPDVDLIQLRAPKDANGVKKRIPFAWTENLHEKAASVGTINRAIQAADITLDVTQAEWRQIMEHIARKEDPEAELAEENDTTLDLTQNALYRIYNNGSFEQGGRFYGGWWQALPKRWRSYIKLNGERVVEVDFAAMHPTALSHQIGIAVAPNFYEIGLADKPVVKAAFNALINARSTWVKPVSGFDEKAQGMSWTQFLQRLKQHYSSYRPFFGSGYGLRLQNLDSEVAERVMLHFTGRGEVILPIHDSFLCPQRLEEELRAVMETSFREISGGTIHLHAKRLTRRQLKEIGKRTV